MRATQRIQIDRSVFQPRIGPDEVQEPVCKSLSKRRSGIKDQDWMYLGGDCELGKLLTLPDFLRFAQKGDP